ncbi:jg2850 [Pararge aegeria aegeria]|uniref:Jg2850 protein n=1 Tax=Pararge aegeria aegeria TaxID=348720 RepID=A0A8S4SGB8_9NEOP|nr:jg2850 [Pararge aegeria aegeria]
MSDCDFRGVGFLGRVNKSYWVFQSRNPQYNPGSEIGGVFPCLGEHVKLTILRLISLRVGFGVQSDYDSEGIDIGPVFATSLVLFRVIRKSLWRLNTVSGKEKSH